MGVTMKGEAVELSGAPLEVGKALPAFTVLDHDLNEVTSASLKGRTCVINAVVSLDTGVCDRQMRRFNDEASDLARADMIVISMDLPFAQKRWLTQSHANSVRTLSDHRDASFGRALGLLIPKLRLLARAVYVVDRDGIVRYREVVAEITNEPDYAAAIEAVAQLP